MTLFAIAMGIIALVCILRPQPTIINVYVQDDSKTLIVNLPPAAATVMLPETSVVSTALARRYQPPALVLSRKWEAL